MASILGRHSLTQKDMPEMTTTILTDNLGTAAIHSDFQICHASDKGLHYIADK